MPAPRTDNLTEAIRHYSGRRDLRERFEEKFVKGGEDECWEWQASRRPSGYGQFGMVLQGKNRPVPAHRVAYELYVSPIPEGLFVCHACDNPSCLNPKHLFLGTNQENLEDMRAKGRGSAPPNPIGAAHPNTKLTPESAFLIRAFFDGGYNREAIARANGVTVGCIYGIGNRRTWRHLGEVV